MDAVSYYTRERERLLEDMTNEQYNLLNHVKGEEIMHDINVYTMNGSFLETLSFQYNVSYKDNKGNRQVRPWNIHEYIKKLMTKYDPLTIDAVDFVRLIDDLNELDGVNIKRMVIVDDDADIVEVLTDAAMDAGHWPISFDDSEVAYEFLCNFAQEFDIVVTDYCMPDVTGVDIVELLNQRCPNIQIVVLSGYDNAEEFFEEHDNVNVLAKPEISFIKLLGPGVQKPRVKFKEL